jgi:hypothetical protein
MSRILLIIVYLIVFLFLCTGCYSFRNITINDLPENVDKEINIKIKDGTIFHLKANQSNKLFTKGEYIFIERDSRDSVKITSIESINGKKFDFVKTFFASIWIAVGIITFLVILISVSGGGPGKIT